MAKCVAECDAKVEPGQVKLECEGGTLSGKCEGACQGSCQVDGTAKCGGTCSGTCQGECTGEIVGKCDGACNGTCDGTCEGECSVAFEEPQCDGELKAPEASAECQADCETAMTAKVDCDPGQVRVDAGVETDTEAVKRLEKTLSKNLPILLRVGTSMGARLNASVKERRPRLKGRGGLVR